MASNYINSNTVSILRKKASKSHCMYKVSAIAFDRKGDVLGVYSNSHSRNWNVLDKYYGGRGGTAEHAERRLMAQYGDNVKTILICRVGRSGALRPISPCPTCQKVAKKYGVKIISVCE